MTEIQVADDVGDEATFLSYNGRNYPAFPDAATALRGMKSIKLRDDDVILCAFPKAGTHWVWEITRLLRAGELDKDDICKVFTMIEAYPEETYKDNPSPRILNTHVRFEELPEDVLKNKTKIILVHRNAKDVSVSFYNFLLKVPFYNYSGKWENFLRPFTEGKYDYGSWFDYMKNWEDAQKANPGQPILPLWYEDLIEDPVREAKKISDFLGLSLSDEFIQSVCTQCGFDSMKQIKATAISGPFVFRKGKVGDWKNWFTVAQNERFDQLYREKMTGYDLAVRYSLDK